MRNVQQQTRRRLASPHCDTQYLHIKFNSRMIRTFSSTKCCFRYIFSGDIQNSPLKHQSTGTFTQHTAADTTLKAVHLTRASSTNDIQK